MAKPKKLSLGFCFFPGMKGFHIVVRLKDRPGALSDVLKVLRGHVNLVNSVSYSLEDDRAIWSGFGESLSKAETAEALRKRIGRLPAVLECEVKESDHGLLIDTFHSGLEVAPGRPAAVFPISGISRTFDHLVHTFGSGGETILFEEGSALGTSSGNYLNARLGSGSLDWRIRALLGMYGTHGWGSAGLEVEEPGTRFRVTMRDDFECAVRGKSRRGCNFLRGHLMSTISALSGREFEGEETKCRLRGDPFCEFLLSRKET